MHDCPCCGQPVYITGYCDGSGCTYVGECEESELPTERTLLDFAKRAVSHLAATGTKNYPHSP